MKILDAAAKHSGIQSNFLGTPGYRLLLGNRLVKCDPKRSKEFLQVAIHHSTKQLQNKGKLYEVFILFI